MELDANPADPLPVHLEPAERVSCTLAQVDLLRRIIARLIKRHDLDRSTVFGKFELDHAEIESLLIDTDTAGNAFLNMGDKEMGS